MKYTKKTLQQALSGWLEKSCLLQHLNELFKEKSQSLSVPELESLLFFVAECVQTEQKLSDLQKKELIKIITVFLQSERKVYQRALSNLRQRQEERHEKKELRMEEYLLNQLS